LGKCKAEDILRIKFKADRASINMAATYSLPDIRDAVPSDFRVGLTLSN
jgi:hypothetical protein